MVIVKGESIVTWELELQDEDGDAFDHNAVREEALEFVSDMLQLEGFGSVKASVVGQSDRVMMVRGRCDPASTSSSSNA